MPEGILSVRLECVMHAVSVHPEPGSNSRMLVSTEFFFELNKSISELQFSSILLRVNSFPILKKELSRFRRTVLLFSFFRTIDCCSIFKDHRLLIYDWFVFLVSWQLLYYITVWILCQEVFQNFLNFLSNAVLSTLSICDLSIIPHILQFVNY